MLINDLLFLFEIKVTEIVKRILGQALGLSPHPQTEWDLIVFHS